MSLDQIDLARRLLAGDPSVLKELETDVWPGVWRRIEHRFAGRLFHDDMCDVLQDSLWAFWQNREDFDGSKGSVASWFSGIALNKSREMAKQDWVEQRSLERLVDLLEIGASTQVTQDAGAVDAGAEQPCNDSRVLRLRECLQQMSERRRQILLACRACNGDPPASQQLAEELGTTAEVIRQELHSAEATIRQYFAQDALGPSETTYRRQGGVGGGGKWIFACRCHTPANITTEVWTIDRADSGPLECHVRRLRKDDAACQDQSRG